MSCGITEASIADQVVVSAGAATASMTAAVVAAIRPGRRITAWASRNQRPSAARSSPRRASFAPQSAKSAGEMTSAATAATTATVAPAMPIDLRKLCGKTVRVMSAAATVAAEKPTVRPAVPIVTAIASRVAPRTASSSR